MAFDRSNVSVRGNTRFTDRIRSHAISQAIAQAYAVCSPFFSSMSAMAICTKPLARQRCADRVAMLLEVPLVVFLGPVERGRRGDLSDDLPSQRLLPGIT